MQKTALVLRHIHFEDLGTFEAPLRQAGYDLRYLNVGDPDFLDGNPVEPDLLVVLGGPIGVYEDGIYPFLREEREFLAKRLAGNRPTLGICLGAQLIAAALGARVFPTGIKEIGFSPVALTDAGRGSPLRHLEGIPVLHWHGDSYSLPEGAVNLASTPIVRQQAYSIGPTVLGLQFHPEVDTGAGFERWLVGHAAELAGAGIDISALREDARKYGSAMKSAATALLAEWLTGIEDPS